MTEEQLLTRQREQVARILASPGFSSSRQCHDFLAYTSERVFSGRGQIEQADIAHEVLNRKDFDPTIDASVRKLATQVRDRLRQYYEGPGAPDEILVTLPLRSYAPQFEHREVATIPQEAPAARRGRRAAIVLAPVLALAAAAWWYASGPESPSRDIRILTAPGDITHPSADAADGAVRLGPNIGTSGEVAVELTFRPNHEGQQAGVLLWDGPRRWVSLSRRFTSRNYLSLRYQYDNYAGANPELDVFDAEGQSGRPVWLRLVRDGNTFRGFWSADGVKWQEIGSGLSVPLGNARAGIFALNGRRESPSIPADFHLPGRGAVDVSGDESVFPVPGGDWSLTTRLDMIATPAMSAGLFLQGSAGRLRLARYHSGEPAIAFIHDGKLLQTVPDYPGSPAVYLRLLMRGGRILAECSTDGREFRPVGTGEHAASLGKLSHFGTLVSKRAEGEELPPPRFFFVRQDLDQLEWLRFPGR